MATGAVEITPKIARALPVGIHRDVIRNLALVVTSSGVRSWRWRGRVAGRQQAAKVILGHFPAMSPETARAKASALNAERPADVAFPIKRAAAKSVLETSLSCENAHVLYMEAVRTKLDENGRHLAPRYIGEKDRIWRTQLGPELKHRPLGDVTRSELAKAIASIKGHSAANHAVAEAKAFFNWCCHDPSIALSVSPAAYIRKPAATRIRRREFDPRGRELGGFIWAIHAEGADVRDAYMLMLLTGARKMQALGARGNEFLDGVWVMPLEVGRAKNAQPNALKLGPVASAIFKRRGQGLLFPSDKAKTAREWGWQKINERIRSRMEERLKQPVPHWTLHDLRRTLDSGLSHLSVDEQIIERILSHKIQGVKRYYRMYDFLEQKGKALLLWENYIQRICRREKIVLNL